MCLLVMWKILTAQIWEEIYHSLISIYLLPEKQKGCHKGTRGKEVQLYIDQNILNASKTR